jgi:hypothetical protein
MLRSLLGRGHSVDVAIETEKRGLAPDHAALFDGLAEEYEGFSYEYAERPADRGALAVAGLRRGLDYLRYLEPALADANAARERARERAPRPLRLVLRPSFMRRPALRRRLGESLTRLERAVPADASVRAFIQQRSPDVVVVSPLVGLGSAQTDVVRAAREVGVPTVLAVASWDNLTSKGVVKDIPDLTLVWNEAQAAEAVHIHGIPRDRVAVVGAHTFDHWFGWEPSSSREEFARTVELDAGRPLVLYVGSSHFISGEEPAFVREWLARVRADPRLQDIGVIVRPHPQNTRGYFDAELDDPGRTVVWPRASAAPTTDEKKADYYDSIFHSAAVIGISTSALIEAAIVRRPVLTITDERFRTKQEGTLHFHHLAGEDGRGVLVVGHSWEEHLAQLARVIEGREDTAERIERFIEEFVRPFGRGHDAAPRAADAIETAARARPAPARRGTTGRSLARAFVALGAGSLLLRDGRRWLTARTIRRTGQKPLEQPPELSPKKHGDMSGALAQPPGPMAGPDPEDAQVVEDSFRPT